MLRELSEGGTVSAQARQLFAGLWEVVWARRLQQLAPELWPVMLVDEDGHGKGATAQPPWRRALWGGRHRWRRPDLSGAPDQLLGGRAEGFTQEEAERLRDLLFRQTGRGRS